VQTGTGIFAHRGGTLFLWDILMHTPSQNEVTQMLAQLAGGNREVIDKLLPLVYDKLRELAANYLRRERSGHTMQATALVHEAYLKLVDQQELRWQNRAHFFGVAAQAMRRILVDYARGHRAAKRGHGQPKVALDEVAAISEERSEEIVALDEALTKLAAFDPQQSKIVELRYFSGLTLEETAEALGISASTVKREWNMAKAWLHREIKNAE
jgi:RNA polymerase sigma factor (TIGR02999 family)